jgi:hypothetical protein
MVIAAFAALVGCSEPPVPPEVSQAISQEQDLWRAGASVFAPDDYTAYRVALEQSRNLLNTERSRFIWFQNYDPVRNAFAEVLRQGTLLEQRLETRKREEGQNLRTRLENLEGTMRLLRELAVQLKDTRLAGRRQVRAEIDLSEARRLLQAGEGRKAAPLLDRAARELREKVSLVRPLVQRFTAPEQIRRWQQLAEETVAASRTSQGLAIVISKLERDLILYRAGKEVRRYHVGFGFNYLSDKVQSGDKATPEGRYRVVHKNPHSRYFRALLLDYPNQEDRQDFQAAKRRGLISPQARIGGLIEIHGGGRSGLTYGCVALENDEMEELFNTVPAGTPVTIVGTRRSNNALVEAMKELR